MFIYYVYECVHAVVCYECVRAVVCVRVCVCHGVCMSVCVCHSVCMSVCIHMEARGNLRDQLSPATLRMLRDQTQVTGFCGKPFYL